RPGLMFVTLPGGVGFGTGGPPWGCPPAPTSARHTRTLLPGRTRSEEVFGPSPTAASLASGGGDVTGPRAGGRAQGLRRLLVRAGVVGAAAAAIARASATHRPKRPRPIPPPAGEGGEGLAGE